jgi:hypothetical protein
LVLAEAGDRVDDRHAPPAQDGMSLRCRLEDARLPFEAPCRAAPQLFDGDALVQPLEQAGAQIRQSLVGEPRRMLKVVGRDDQEVLGAQHRIVGFPGDEQPELLPAGKAPHRRCTALGARLGIGGHVVVIVDPGGLVNVSCRTVQWAVFGGGCTCRSGRRRIVARRCWFGGWTDERGARE